MKNNWTHGTERYRYAARTDLADFVDLLADPEVGRWLWFAPLPPPAVEAYFGPFIDRQTREVEAGTTPQTAVFVVEDAAGAEFLGQGAVVAVEGSPAGFEIGFQLRRNTWGRGVGTRLGQFLCAYAIEVGKAHRIEGGCLEGNAGSANLLRKLGLVLEGTRPDYRLKQATRHTELLFGRKVAELDRAVFRQVAATTGLTPA